MKGFLSENQVNYVLYHFGHSFHLSDDLKMRFVFRKDGEWPGSEGKVIFQMSDQDLHPFDLAWVDQVPVLFPVARMPGFYHMDGDHLVFHHDILKSAFYLLSGYQELVSQTRDSMDRYPYEQSLQCRLGMATRPMVNYYFEIMGEGIQAFCSKHGISFNARTNFRNLAFFLSHDVDAIDTYTWYEAIYRIKQLLGMAPSDHSRSQMLQITWRYVTKSLNVFDHENPHWDFSRLRNVEKSHGIRSAFFFLPRDQRHADAYYSFREKRVQDLFQYLDREGCEIGIHGTVRSSLSQDALDRDVEQLRKVSPQPVLGIRQHRLKYDLKHTPLLHQNAGLLYDATLGFAGHIGFRNSYCLPFRLFDHTNDAMLDVWEIPLTVMDVTLFHYQKLTFAAALESIDGVLKEILKFHGVFTLLWHNGQNNEFLTPGMTEFYLQMIGRIADSEPESLLGREIIERLQINSST
jgi:hypothetical protein